MLETSLLSGKLCPWVRKMTRRHSVFKLFSEELKNSTNKIRRNDKAKATMTSSEFPSNDVSEKPKPCCSKRWILAFALCMMRLCHAAMRQNIGIALVCMSDSSDVRKTGNVTRGNSSTCRFDHVNETVTPTLNHENDTEFQWSSMLEGQVLSAPYYGFLLVIPLAGYLDHALGSCRLLVASLTLGGLLSALTPLMTRQHPYLLVAVRALTGACNGVVKPAVFSLWANWAPVSQRGILTSVEYSGSAIGGILTFFISGFLCSIPLDHGWPFVFYVVGGLSVLCALCLAYLVHDCPARHPTISDSEFKFITTNQTHETHKGKIRPPWLKMARSPAVWAIIVAHVSHHWVFAAIVAYLPMYMRDVLQYKIAENGMLSALPFVGSMIGGLVAGVFADKMTRCMSTVAVRKIFQFTGSVGFSVPIFVVSWLMDTQHRLVAVTLLVGAVTLLNLTSLAYRINCLDIAPRYASFITSVSFTIATALSLTAPVVTSAILVEKSNEEWQKVLYIVTAISLAGGIFYVIFARGDVQPWALDNTYDVNSTVDREQVPSESFHGNETCIVLSIKGLNSST